MTPDSLRNALTLSSNQLRERYPVDRLPNSRVINLFDKFVPHLEETLYLPYWYYSKPGSVTSWIENSLFTEASPKVVYPLSVFGLASHMIRASEHHSTYMAWKGISGVTTTFFLKNYGTACCGILQEEYSRDVRLQNTRRATKAIHRRADDASVYSLRGMEKSKAVRGSKIARLMSYQNHPSETLLFSCKAHLRCFKDKGDMHATSSF